MLEYLRHSANSFVRLQLIGLMVLAACSTSHQSDKNSVSLESFELISIDGLVERSLPEEEYMVVATSSLDPSLEVVASRSGQYLGDLDRHRHIINLRAEGGSDLRLEALFVDFEDAVPLDPCAEDVCVEIGNEQVLLEAQGAEWLSSRSEKVVHLTLNGGLDPLIRDRIVTDLEFEYVEKLNVGMPAQGLDEKLLLEPFVAGEMDGSPWSIGFDESTGWFDLGYNSEHVAEIRPEVLPTELDRPIQIAMFGFPEGALILLVGVIKSVRFETDERVFDIAAHQVGSYFIAAIPLPRGVQVSSWEIETIGGSSFNAEIGTLPPYLIGAHYGVLSMA